MSKTVDFFQHTTEGFGLNQLVLRKSDSWSENSISRKYLKIDQGGRLIWPKNDQGDQASIDDDTARIDDGYTLI